MKYLICALLFCLCTHVAHADVPVITYEQKVEIVVEVKKNPAILDFNIEQKDKDVTLNAIVDKDVDHQQSIAMAQRMVWLTKNMSLDDKPTKEDRPGKGLFQYKVIIHRADGILLLQGHKKAEEEALTIDPAPALDPPIAIQPWTRADGMPPASNANH